MNSNSFLSVEEYVLSLEKKRDVEIPQQLLETDQEIQKLKERRADLLKSIRDTSLEIEHLKREPQLNSLVDIPTLAWQCIRQNCIREQNSGILDVCLASPELDRIIKGDAVNKNTLRLTGEKVFRILLENRYLDYYDVRNCLNSNSRDLERFAGSTWVYEVRAYNVNGREVFFHNSAEIAEFAKIANESKQKWKLFAFKTFNFIADPLHVPGANYEEFWMVVFTFIKSFGMFLLRVSLDDKFGRDGGMRSIYKDLFQLLPRIDTFYARVWENHGVERVLSVRPVNDHRGSHSLHFESMSNVSHPFLEGVGPHCRTWNFGPESLQQVSPEQLSPHFCRNVRVLELDGQKWLPETQDLGLQHFIDADLSNFANVTSLVWMEQSSHSVNSLALLEKFPRVKTIELLATSVETPEQDVAPPFAKFPTVTSLILSMEDECLPLPLDRIPQLLPSLTQITIKFIFDHKTVAARLLKALTEDGYFQQQNKLIDVYRIYSEGRSILESNIWQYLPNLARITVQTEEAHHGYYGKKDINTEIFVRPKY